MMLGLRARPQHNRQKRTGKLDARKRSFVPFLALSCKGNMISPVIGIKHISLINCQEGRLQQKIETTDITAVPQVTDDTLATAKPNETDRTKHAINIPPLLTLDPVALKTVNSTSLFRVK
jgi:hypothetical protein